MTDSERFTSKLAPADREGCRMYEGATQSGYGVFSLGKKAVKAHRYAYELEHGPIPEGMTVDHECHNLALSKGECAPGACRHRACCNPEHMILRGMWDNTRRGGSFTATHSRKDRCPRGHEYSGRNSRGERVCKKCQADASKRYRAKARLDATMIIVRDEPVEE